MASELHGVQIPDFITLTCHPHRGYCVRIKESNPKGTFKFYLSKKQNKTKPQTIMYPDWDGEEETVENIGHESYYMQRHEILAARSMS